jgi:hypothetical protein
MARKHERRRIEHAYEAGIAAFAGTARLASRVDRGEKEQVEPFDERAVLVRERRAVQPLLDPVGESLGIELTLQPPVTFPVERGHAGLLVRTSHLTRPAGGLNRVCR